MKRNYTLIIALVIISLGLTINAIAEEPHAREPSFNSIKVWHNFGTEYNVTHAKVLAELGDAWFGGVHVADFNGGEFVEIDLAHRWYIDDHIAIYGGPAWRRIWYDAGHVDDYVAELGVAVGFNQHFEGRLDVGYNFIEKGESNRLHNYLHFNAELEFHPVHFEGLAFSASLHFDEHKHNWRPGIGVAYHW